MLGIVTELVNKIVSTLLKYPCDMICLEMGQYGQYYAQILAFTGYSTILFSNILRLAKETK